MHTWLCLLAQNIMLLLIKCVIIANILFYCYTEKVHIFCGFYIYMVGWEVGTRKKLNPHEKLLC